MFSLLGLEDGQLTTFCGLLSQIRFEFARCVGNPPSLLFQIIMPRALFCKVFCQKPSGGTSRLEGQAGFGAVRKGWKARKRLILFMLYGIIQGRVFLRMDLRWDFGEYETEASEGVDPSVFTLFQKV